MILACLLACGGPADPVEAPPEPVAVAEDPAENDDPSWGSTCTPTNELGCVSWARKARRMQQPWREFLEPSCERAYGESCFWLGEYQRQDGAEPAVTTPLFERACDLGSPNGCLQYAAALDGDERQGILEKGCALKCVHCCQQAGLPPPTW